MLRSQRTHAHPHHPHAEEEDEQELHDASGHEEAEDHREDGWSRGTPISDLLGVPELNDAEGVGLPAGHQPDHQAHEGDEAGIDRPHDAGRTPSIQVPLGGISRIEEGFPVLYGVLKISIHHGWIGGIGSRGIGDQLVEGESRFIPPIGVDPAEDQEALGVEFEKAEFLDAQDEGAGFGRGAGGGRSIVFDVSDSGSAGRVGPGIDRGSERIQSFIGRGGVINLEIEEAGGFVVMMVPGLRSGSSALRRDDELVPGVLIEAQNLVDDVEFQIQTGFFDVLLEMDQAILQTQGRGVEDIRSSHLHPADEGGDDDDERGEDAGDQSAIPRPGAA